MNEEENINFFVLLFQIENPNASWSIATHVLLAAHMLFVNILLTNLLIAMFKYEDETQKFKRCLLLLVNVSIKFMNKRNVFGIINNI